MREYMRWLRLVAAAVFILAVPPHAGAQPDPVNFRFNSGQAIHPIFEGWSRNPDGTISMYFGYINRNYAQELAVPIGEENSFLPGPPDRGQPTFFYTREHRQVFQVTLPASWGKTQELVWTLTANGTSLKAVGWLQPEWQIDPIFGGENPHPERKVNKAPTLIIDVPATAGLRNPVNLNARVIDDGLPSATGRTRGNVGGAETPLALQKSPNEIEAPVNVPQVSSGGRGNRNALTGAGDGPWVTWRVWRGPAGVSFSPGAGNNVQVTDQTAVVAATFTQPGTYVLRARASDGWLFDLKDVTVTVK
jgi:hypothetical protein